MTRECLKGLSLSLSLFQLPTPSPSIARVSAAATLAASVIATGVLSLRLSLPFARAREAAVKACDAHLSRVALLLQSACLLCLFPVAARDGSEAREGMMQNERPLKAFFFHTLLRTHTTLSLSFPLLPSFAQALAHPRVSRAFPPAFLRVCVSECECSFCDAA